MTPNDKRELKIVSKTLGYLAEGNAPTKRWKRISTIACAVGAFGISFPFFSIAGKDTGTAVLLAIVALSGICLGVGLLFGSSALSWPIMLRCIDKEKLLERRRELEAQKN